MNQILFSANTYSTDILDLVKGGVVQSTPSSFKQVEVVSSSVDSSPLFFATENDNSNLKVFALNDQQKTVSISLSVHLDVFKISPSGTWLVGGVNASLKVWEISSGNLVTSLDLDSNVSALEFTQDNGILLSATESGKVYGWRFYELFNKALVAAFVWETGASVKQVRTGHGQGLVYTVSHRKIDEMIESSVKIWNLMTDDVDSPLIYTYDVNSEITAVCFDSAERALYAGTASGEILPLERFVVNPTTGLVDYPVESGQVASVDITKSQTLVHGTSAGVTSLALAGDGILLVAGYTDGTVASFKTSSRELEITLKPADTRAVTNVFIFGSIEQGSIRTSGISELPKSFSNDKSSTNNGSRPEHEVWIKLQDRSPLSINTSEITKEAAADFEQKIRVGTNFFSSSETASGETSNDEEAALRLKIQQLERELAQATQ